ncbi:MAG TPA: DUF4340 domain-containing protein [Anaeromyxobacteraceae bacterium]|nr:DUF4340 domain-containing protein [Anaeromyxobacteraceae bacterium]
MRARTRTLASTGILLLVALGAVAFAFYGVEKKDEAKAALKNAEEKLFHFEPARVNAISLEAKGETTRLVRKDGAWRLAAPVEAEAERAAVDALVDGVAHLKRKAAISSKPDGTSLSRYGLTSPRARVTLTLEGGKSETLALGEENAFDGSAFVETSRGEVDLVDGGVKWWLEKNAFDLRDKRLLPFEEEDLAQLEIATPHLRYALTREKGHYRLAAPVAEAADEGTVSNVLSAVRGLRATSFVSSPAQPAAYGLDHPAYSVKLVTKSGASRQLDIGEGPPPPGPEGKPSEKAGAKIYARLLGSSEVAGLASGATSGLDVDLFALRDKKVLHFDREKVALVRFTVKGTTFEGKAGTGPGKVSDALFALSSLAAKSFPEAAASSFGLDHPTTEVVLLDERGQKLDRLVLSEQAGKTYARSDSSPRPAEVDPSDLTALPKGAGDLASPPALASPGPGGASGRVDPGRPSP